MPDQWDGRYTSADAEIIKQKVRKIVGEFPFLSNQREDLQQEAALHVSLQSHRYNPGRGPRGAFVASVTEHKLRNIAARERAQKRDRRKDVAIEAVGEGVLLDDRENPAAKDLELDMRKALDALPADQRNIADLIREGLNEADVIRHTGLSRQKVRGLLGKIAAHVESFGFKPQDSNHSARHSGS